MAQRDEEHVSVHKPDNLANAALTSLLAEADAHAPVSHRLPRIKLTAYILIGLVLFSVSQSLLMSGVILSLGNIEGSNPFLNAVTIFGWGVLLTAAVILLFTKSVNLAKKIVLSMGLVALYFAITELIHFNIIGLGLDIFIVWWFYELYQSLEALAIEVN